jgi:hypothetical protein
VDWEPLVMRFVPSQKLRPSEAQHIARFIRIWLNAAADTQPAVWSMAKEWDCKVSRGNIVARCEFFPPRELSRLAQELGRQFPVLQELRLGYPLNGSRTASKFDWFLVDAGNIRVGNQDFVVKTFQISLSPVTAGQFEEFLAATGYEPVPDRIERIPNFLIDHFKLNFGPSPKHPLFGVTHDDAVAFCNWAKLRLPSEAELKSFFHCACLKHQRFRFTGECWTSTGTAKDKFVAWNGPYQETGIKEPEVTYRKELHRHQYQPLEAPCFRVVRNVEP